MECVYSCLNSQKWLEHLPRLQSNASVKRVYKSQVEEQGVRRKPLEMLISKAEKCMRLSSSLLYPRVVALDWWD